MKNKGLKCKIEGCEKSALTKGMCSRHYYRYLNGITDMRPGRIYGLGMPWKPDDPRYKNKNVKCKVAGCDNLYKAKGYCHNHYVIYLKRGTTDPIVKPPCSVEGCTKLGGRKGMCKFHLDRARNGISLLRSKGIKGELNPRWNGGVSQYQNHYEMKKIRKELLLKTSYTCSICGGKAYEIHHIDGSKDNHSKENIMVVCRKCHAKLRKTSKFIRLYGNTSIKISEQLGISIATVLSYHKKGILRRKLSIFMSEDVRNVLF